MSPRPKEIKTKRTPTKAMINWMHENADDDFRFAPIYAQAEDRVYPVGCHLHGSEADLTLFRINFGF